MRRLTGIGVSPGIVAGRAVILIQRAQVLRYQVAAARVDHELNRLEQSRLRTRHQLTEIRASVARQRGRELASLFDAQLLMLDDPMLIPRATAIVREQRVNAEWAIQQVFQEFSAVFDEVADPYLRERRGDVADLVGRLKMNLRQGLETPRDLLKELDEASYSSPTSSRRRWRRRWTGPRCAASRPMPGAERITRRFWPARSKCRPLSDCTTPAGSSKPVDSWFWTAKAAS